MPRTLSQKRDREILRGNSPPPPVKYFYRAQLVGSRKVRVSSKPPNLNQSIEEVIVPNPRLNFSGSNVYSISPNVIVPPSIQSHPIKIDDLTGLYNFFDEESKFYLASNLFLVSFLERTYSKFDEFFDFNNISIQLIFDRDLSDNPQLVLRINTSDNVDSVIENQHLFDEDYWLNCPDNITENIIISFDFE